MQEVIMNQNNNAISLVENLIETCRDGEKGYKDAASHIKRTDLKTFFIEQGAQRARFADELQLELSKLGKAEKKESGSVGGAMHRAWIDTKVAVGGGDKTILESVERGEDSAKENYQKALSGGLPPNVAEIVRRQASNVMNAHDRVRDLRDAA
jgi:uncharacterized protein (TIGR02284 family)